MMKALVAIFCGASVSLVVWALILAFRALREDRRAANEKIQSPLEERSQFWAECRAQLADLEFRAWMAAEARREQQKIYERAVREWECATVPLPDWMMVMGFTSRPTADEVRQRYRHLAKTLHPDHGGDAAAFAKLSRAKDEGLASLATLN